MIMASTKQTIKLYWVTSHDHDHDWFVFADSASVARAYHEQYEGYNQREASGKPGLNGEIFRDGIIEAIIELGRKHLEVVPKNCGGLDHEASPSTVRPEGPRGGANRSAAGQQGLLKGRLWPGLRWGAGTEGWGAKYRAGRGRTRSLAITGKLTPQETPYMPNPAPLFNENIDPGSCLKA